MEKFVKPSLGTEPDWTDTTTLNSSTIVNPKTDPITSVAVQDVVSSTSLPVTMDLSKDSKSQSSTPENPLNLKSPTSMLSIHTRNQTKSGDPPYSDAMAMNSFVDLMNLFSTTMNASVPGQKNTSALRLNSDHVSPNTVELVKGSFSIMCPICHQYWGTNSAENGQSLEELAKHLALVHLLPLPAILNCLSMIALNSPQQLGPFSQFPINGTRSRPDSIISESSSTVVHDFKTPVSVPNVIGAKNGTEPTDWAECGTVDNDHNPIGSVDSSSTVELKNLKRDYPIRGKFC